MAILSRHEITKGITPVKLRAIIEDLGPTFVKLGQILSMRQDILPKGYCDELEKLSVLNTSGLSLCSLMTKETMRLS